MNFICDTDKGHEAKRSKAYSPAESIAHTKEYLNIITYGQKVVPPPSVKIKPFPD
ncbi:MAG: hypothetical protein IPN10_14990 [Saprospiraceae bacterium]|nr:hypothetical protein [Saprospiraceae bacterium]